MMLFSFAILFCFFLDGGGDDDDDDDESSEDDCDGDGEDDGTQMRTMKEMIIQMRRMRKTTRMGRGHLGKGKVEECGI